MGYTNRKYPVMEVAIRTRSYKDHDDERAKEGDIIAVRPPHFVIGTAERTGYIWLRIEGLEEGDFGLQRTVFEGKTRFDKRRYSIPLHKLKQVYPAFDINRAKDINDEYQPFIVLDLDTGVYLAPHKPFSVHGLVFDKVKGEYL